MKEYDNVPVFFIDSKSGKRSEHSLEDLHSRQLNQWQNWYCASGNRSLYIDFDGNVFAGTCEVGGWRGNIYREGFDVQALDKWIQCTKKFCSCGADMSTPKVRTANLIPAKADAFRELLGIGLESNQTAGGGAAVPPENADMVLCRNGVVFKLIIWDLGRRCNFSCTYCYPGSHNNYESHKTLKSLQHAVDRIHGLWQRGERGLFSITGGEPTVHPEYIELVEYILSKNPSNVVTTATNGSRDPQYFARLFKLSSLSFSAHLETLQNERAYANFIANVAKCVEMKKSGEVPRRRFVQARIMLKPGMLKLAERLREDLRNIPDAQLYARLQASLLHQSDERSLFSQYTEGEKSFVADGQL